MFAGLYRSMEWVREKAVEVVWPGMVANAFESRREAREYRMLVDSLKYQPVQDSAEQDRRQQVLTQWMNDRVKELQAIKAGLNPQQADTKKAEIQFSFYTDDPDAEPIREVTLPIEDLTVTVQLLYRAVGNVPAKPGSVWIRVCRGCKYASEPPGFIGIPDKPEDRQGKFTEVLFPYVDSEKIEFKIMPPMFPHIPAGMEIRCYYACENCPNVDSKKPQILIVKLKQK